MKKIVVTITGIRPDFIRMSKIFKKFDENFEHILIHTGQHYDKMLSDVFFDELNIRKPNYNLEIGGKGKEHFHQLGDLSIKIIELLREKNIKPDLICFLGDSNSVASAISLKKEGYRIGHIEAGMRSYDKHMLEEINRIICDHCSDYLFVYHDNYKEKAQREGITDGVFVVGNTIVEVANEFSKDLFLNPKENNQIILDVHRPENFNFKDRLTNIIEYANMMQKKYNLPVKMLNFGRTEHKLTEYGIDLGNIELVPLMSYKNYLKNTYNSKFIISDCLHPDSNVVYKNGLIKKISNIDKNQYLISNDKYNKIELFESKKVEKKYQITTKYNTILCSENHRLLVKCDDKFMIEKKVKDITNKDKIVSFCKIDTIPVELKLNSITNKKYVKITDAGLSILKEISIGDNLTRFGKFKCNTIRLKKGVSYIRLCEVLKYLNIDIEYFEQFLYLGDKKHKRQHDITQPNYISESLSEMIGFLCGDGYVDKYHVSFYDENIKTLKYINNIVNKTFGLNSNIKKDKRNNTHYIKYSSKSFVEYLKINFNSECENTLTKNKDISDIILTSDNVFVSSYIRGLFEAEGYVGDHNIGIQMSDKNVIEKLKILLLRFGVIANYYENEPKREKDKSTMYALSIYENESIKIFKDKIGFISDYKNNKLNAFLIKNKDKIQKPVKRYDNLYYDIIRKIEIITDDVNYVDIHVTPSNMFMVNGILSHNSGTAQEEPALLNTPVIVPREFTERPESVEFDCSFMIDVNTKLNATWTESLLYIDDIIKGFKKIDIEWLGSGDTADQITNKIKELLNNICS